VSTNLGSFQLSSQYDSLSENEQDKILEIIHILEELAE
jgi:hypothetical protein